MNEMSCLCHCLFNYSILLGAVRMNLIRKIIFQRKLHTLRQTFLQYITSTLNLLQQMGFFINFLQKEANEKTGKALLRS